MYKISNSQLDDRIFTYLQQNPEVPHAVAKAMLRYEIIRGMSSEEVIVVAGYSSRVQFDKETGDEIWNYGYLWSDQRLVHIRFRDGSVVNVEDRGIPPLYN